MIITENASGLTNLLITVPNEVKAKILEYFYKPENENEELEIVLLINGDVNVVKKKVEDMGGKLSDLGFNFAIATIDISKLEGLISISEIRYFELPKPMYTTFEPSNKVSCVIQAWENYKLTGKGVLVGFIDTGIDYLHPAFRNEDGTTRIKYIYDVGENKVWNENDINEAIKAPDPYSIVNQQDIAGHGTHVAGIACAGGKIDKKYYGVAYESNIAMVKMTRTKQTKFAHSTQLMRGIKFLVDKFKELNIPLVINLSFSTNDGSHDGKSLLELYIQTIASLEKLNFVIAAGNEGDRSHHASGELRSEQEISFNVGGDERTLVIQLYKNFINDISIKIKNPSGIVTDKIKINKKYIAGKIGLDDFYIYNTGAQPFNMNGEVVFSLVAGINEILKGVWTITIYYDGALQNQRFNMWLPISEGLSEDTKFLSPNQYNTLGIPGTVSNVITVGSYDLYTENISSFSGRGSTDNFVIKPDLVAPGEKIEAPIPNNSFDALSGTSMATPTVAGAAALLMEWGIVQARDSYMYGDRLKYFLLKSAKRDRVGIDYPNPTWGYGTLCVSRALDTWILESSRKEESIMTEKKEEMPKVNTNTSNVIGCIKDFLSEDYENYIITYYGDIDKAMANIDYACIIKLDNDYALGAVKPGESERLMKEVKVITYMERNSLYTLTYISPLEASNISKFHNSPYLTLRGNGVLIGILDTGIDYLNKEFQYEDSTTRIVNIWDQTINAQVDKSGFMGIGREYTRQEIDEAIKAQREGKDPYAIVETKDEYGHGTKVAGIAAARDETIGVAPDSELVIVKLRESKKNLLKIYGVEHKTIPIYTNGEIVLGIKYLFNKARELNKPMVIYIPLGTNTGGHDGGAFIEMYIDEISKSLGIAVVVGTGNEGESSTHSSGTIENSGEEKTVELKIDDNQKNLLVQVWTKKPNKISMGLVSPSGEFIERIPAKLNEKEEIKLVFEGSNIYLQYYYPERFTGDELIVLYIENAKGGIWQIKLYGDSILDGRFDLWIPQRDLLAKETRFLNASPYTTLMIPATCEKAIVTSYYDQNNNTILAASGRGYDRNGRIKPDVTTGGVEVRTTTPGGSPGILNGSSAAGAVLAGAVALLFEWGMIKGNDVTMYADKIRAYLIRGTIQRQGDTYPNTQWGYGILDLEGIFKNIRGFTGEEKRYLVRVPEDIYKRVSKSLY